MTDFILNFNCDNAAFYDGTTETARILRDCAERIEHGYIEPSVIKDINGNTIGHYGYHG